MDENHLIFDKEHQTCLTLYYKFIVSTDDFNTKNWRYRNNCKINNFWQPTQFFMYFGYIRKLFEIV